MSIYHPAMWGAIMFCALLVVIMTYVFTAMAFDPHFVVGSCNLNQSTRGIQ